MKKVLYIVPLLAVLALAGCSIARNSSQTNENVKTVKLGVIVPLSGDAQVYGEQIQRTLDYRLQAVNEKHKKDNIKFEFVYEDGKCTGNDAVNAFQKLTEIDGIKFILGGACSSETLAIVPLAQEGKVFATSMFSSSSKINKASEYVYSFSYSNDLIGKTVAQEMSKYKKLAIVTEQNDYNTDLENGWLETLKNYPDVQIVAKEKFPKGGTDFRNILEKVRKAQPDAIFLNPNVGLTTDNLTKQLAEIKGWTGYQLFGVYPFLSTSVLSAAPALLEGMTIVDAPNLTNPDLEKINAEIEATKGTVKDVGIYSVAATMDDLDVVTDLIAELGEDPDKVRNAFATRDFHGFTAKNFNFKDSSFPSVEAAVYTIKNNKAELVK